MSTAAAVGNLSQFVGEAKTFNDAIVTSTGAPQDITGWTSTMWVYDYGDPDTVYFNIVGVFLGPSVNGVFQYVNLPSNTVGMKPGQYAFSIQRDDGSGTPPANAAVPTVGLFTLLQGSTFD
jgi:hypothetical protein